MQRRAVTLALATGAFGVTSGLAGCALPGGRSSVPMDVIRDDGGCASTLAPTLLVLLPGRHMPPAELVREGFVAAVRQRGLAVDVVLPDAHIGYVQDGSLQSRLHDEVIAPALAQGRRRIWLAGISMGGFVALAYARRDPRGIAGVLAMAPYLGRMSLLQAIEERGGPAAWRTDALARDTPRNSDDIEREVWLDLADPQRNGPPVWLAYGEQDRLGAGHRLLAQVLPPQQVSVVPGGHDWPPWRTLWAQWLDRDLLPRAGTTSADSC